MKKAFEINKLWMQWWDRGGSYWSRKLWPKNKRVIESKAGYHAGYVAGYRAATRRKAAGRKK